MIIGHMVAWFQENNILNSDTVWTVLAAIRNLNIFFTLLAGLLAIIVWESNAKLITRIIGIVLIDALTVVLGCEWMIFGVPIILGTHIFRDAPKKRFIFFAVCTIATQFITWA